MAKKQPAKRKPARRKAPTPTTARLLHDLEVHQVELEIQNEELRTARGATEVALARYTEVFDFAPIGYVTLDEHATIREINHAACNLLGQPRALLVGKRFGGFVQTSSVRAFDGLLASARLKAETARAELELVRTDGPSAVRLSATALRRGEVTYLLACEDISERKAREVELSRATQELEASNRRKDTFLAMLSHELRNPLSPIRTSVEILQLAPADSPAAREAIAIIDRSTAHLTRLVDDLLDVTRITRGRIALQRERLDLAELIRRTIADHAPELAQHGVALDVQIADGELWVHGDPARLVQVVSNLLTNAEKFTLPGGKVTVSAGREHNSAVVRVRDTGVGIALELIDLVFEPFVQAPQSLDRSRGGLGLGLAMVRSLVTLHGGRVSIHSEGLGRGTEITFSVPLLAGRALPEPREWVDEIERCRVLIIEDKADAAEALSRALGLKGHAVQTAHDGVTGLQIAARFAPDVVLCDVGLPHLDGYAIARRLRGSGAYLVALTGYASADDVERARDAGFACHLAKPARLEQIEQVIARAPRRAPSSLP